MERKVYRVYYGMEKEYPVVPLDTVRKLLGTRGRQREILISGNEIFPDGYMEYLKKVLNVNRHLPLFSYSYIESRLIGKKEIQEIAEKQLEHLKAEDFRCFRKIIWEKNREKEERILISFTDEFLRICREQNSIFIISNVWGKSLT